jgi:hypothetical protein
MSKFSIAWSKLAYQPNGEFSMTRIFMFVTFFWAIILGIIGLIAFLCWGKVLPNNLYSYVGSLAGGGIVQYGFTKHVQAKEVS